MTKIGQHCAECGREFTEVTQYTTIHDVLLCRGCRRPFFERLFERLFERQKALAQEAEAAAMQAEWQRRTTAMPTLADIDGCKECWPEDWQEKHVFYNGQVATLLDEVERLRTLNEALMAVYQTCDTDTCDQVDLVRLRALLGE